MAIFDGFLDVAKDVLIALAPLIGAAIVSHFTVVRFERDEVRRLVVGTIMTWAGLTLFLQGVFVGFEPVGNHIGKAIASGSFSWTLVPLGLLLGTIAAAAEPSVIVMSHTVDRVSAGSIPRKVFIAATAGAVGIAVALAMGRVVWGIPLLWILIPGYAIVFLLTRYAPPAFTGVAFDAGGVATGPITSTFILAISLGAAATLPGRSAIIEGFGLVALVFLAPVLSLTTLGAIYGRKARQQKAELERANSQSPEENPAED